MISIVKNIALNSHWRATGGALACLWRRSDVVGAADFWLFGRV